MFSLKKPSKIFGHMFFWWLAQRINLVEYLIPMIFLPSISEMHKYDRPLLLVSTSVLIVESRYMCLYVLI